MDHMNTSAKEIKKMKLRENPIIKYIMDNSGILIGLIALCAIVSAIVPDKFLQTGNILNILRQISPNAIIAFGMAFVIITGGIDLSVGSIVALSGTVCAGFISSGLDFVPAIIIGLGVGTLCGVFNGFVISRTAIPPFIVTMAMLQIARGASYLYSGGKPIRTPDEFGAIGNGYVFDTIPVSMLIMIGVMIIMAIVLSKSKFGRSVYAFGGNAEAAKFSGINTKKVVWSVYIISAFLSAVAGIITASRLYSGQPTVAEGGELDAIAATVLGGVSMAGGVGKIGGVIIGAIIIGVLNNGFNLMKVDSYWQMIAKGAIILLAVLIDVKRKKTEVK